MRTPLMIALDYDDACISASEVREHESYYGSMVIDDEEMYYDSLKNDSYILASESECKRTKLALDSLGFTEDQMRELSRYTGWWFNAGETEHLDMFLAELFDIYRDFPRPRDYHALPDIGSLYL